MIGSDILAIAKEHIGEDYILGARAVLSNPDHSGPWDCAEFASWCAENALDDAFERHPDLPGWRNSTLTSSSRSEAAFADVERFLNERL